MKAMCIHAHYDDYEFTAAGTFELWRRTLGNDFKSRVLICTDGKAGHHQRTREETGQVRYQEQMASARAGEYDCEVLHLPDGQVPREACLDHTPGFLAALWKAIRDFEPDYLFCPPIPSDPLAGVHLDHLAVAEAVRKVAYLINVPHCFTPEYPEDETVPQFRRTPVILNTFDGYMGGAGNFDFAVDIESVFSRIAAMSFCHQSQIMEWLPWVGRHSMKPPGSLEEWQGVLRKRFEGQNRSLNIHSPHAVEVFTVTGWGVLPTMDQIRHDFPNLTPSLSHLDRLEARLNLWS